MQIYKSILNFKQAEENPYNLKVNYTFRYNSFQSIGSASANLKASSQSLYIYILNNLGRYNATEFVTLDQAIAKTLTIDLHPDKVGIHRQRIKQYLDELVALNFICKAGDRGYDYHVNPYHYNVMTRSMAHHCFMQMLQLLQLEPLPLVCLVEQ